MYEIIHRYTSAVLYKSESATDIKAAVVEAVASGANLRGADLRGADLYGAYLGGAYLYGANMGGANLSGGNLRGADLRGANLSVADLSGADLRGANLRGADLSGADLRGANGLLGNGIVPLQIVGTAHILIVREAGFVTIGCLHHPLTWWEGHYEAVGRKESYSAEQITEYRAHIAHARQWMEQYGVAAPGEGKQ
jgi:hypothetical protein